MLKFLKNIFDENQRKIDQYSQVVEQINDLEPQIRQKSDQELAEQTNKFKQQIKEFLEEEDPQTDEELKLAEKEILNQLLPEAYATVREVSRRVLGMRHFDVQLIAGIAIHNGIITEQKNR